MPYLGTPAVIDVHSQPDNGIASNLGPLGDRRWRFIQGMRVLGLQYRVEAFGQKHPVVEGIASDYCFKFARHVSRRGKLWHAFCDPRNT